MLRETLPPPSDGDDFMTTFGSPQATQANTTPTPPTTDSLDDVFGSAPSSPTLRPSEGISRPNGSHHPQHPSEIPRLRSTHVTNGYREGLSVAKEEALQAGFDEGYSLGAELGMKAGWILGTLDGLLRASSTSSDKVIRDSNTLDRANLIKEAERELGLQSLCGPPWIDGDTGIWTYDVPEDSVDRDAVMFAQVAAAHPVIVKWMGKVRDLA